MHNHLRSEENVQTGSDEKKKDSKPNNNRP